MAYTKNQLLQQELFKNFDRICQIPHASGHEKALSDDLLSWARSLGLEAEQDAHHNLIIRKPATPGYENAPPIMLQAHIDMVGDQVEGGTFNFLEDPIHWVVQGDAITTEGKTTLGADDGIGVAMAMTILADRQHPHPPVEVAFTTMEEVDFSGADAFDFPFLAQYFINLDGSDDRQIFCGSSGGMDADIFLPARFMPVPDGWVCVRAAINGFAGGHSGREISKGRDSAIGVLGRLLLRLNQDIPFLISDLSGGSTYIAISQNAWADLVLKEQDLPRVKELLAPFQSAIQAEHPLTGDKISITLHPVPRPETAAEPSRIITWLTLAPNGIVQMNEMFSNVVASSVNLGLVQRKEDKFYFKFDIRSLSEPMGEFTYQKLKWLANLTDAACQSTIHYPSWMLRADSKLRDRAVQVYRKHFGCDPDVTTIHVGLEVGYFIRKKPEIDAISIGPKRWGNHTPTESLSISSAIRCMDYLFSLLEEMH